MNKNIKYSAVVLCIVYSQLCECSKNYHDIGQKKYYIESVETVAKNADWFDVRQDCLDNAGSLVAVETAQELLSLQTYLLSVGYSNGSTFFSSGNNFDDANKFKWESNGQLVQYTKWLPGEPPEDDKFLISLELFNSELYMRSSKYNDRYYICERLPLIQRLLQSEILKIVTLMAIAMAMLLACQITQMKRLQKVKKIKNLTAEKSNEAFNYTDIEKAALQETYVQLEKS